MKLRINYQGKTYITKEFKQDDNDDNIYTLKDLNNYVLNIISKKNLNPIRLNLENGSILIMCNEAIKRSVFIIEE
jgi:hypothetical protein